MLFSFSLPFSHLPSSFLCLSYFGQVAALAEQETVNKVLQGHKMNIFPGGGGPTCVAWWHLLQRTADILGFTVYVIRVKKNFFSVILLLYCICVKLYNIEI